MDKLQNFWFYYKKHLLIGLAVLLTLGYLAGQKAAAPQPDYHIGLVRAVPCTQEELDALNARFAAAGEDRNGDGQILVQIHTYFVDLADDSSNAALKRQSSCPLGCAVLALGSLQSRRPRCEMGAEAG